MSPKKRENPGTSFQEQQQAVDKAINERAREEHGTDKLDPQDAERAHQQQREATTARKKTGGGTQKTTGSN